MRAISEQRLSKGQTGKLIKSVGTLSFSRKELQNAQANREQLHHHLHAKHPDLLRRQDDRNMCKLGLCHLDTCYRSNFGRGILK